MQKNYIRVSENIPQTPSTRFLILGYTSQFLLYVTIIVYCVLSPSLFSTIALLYMLISFAVIIATPYYVQKRNQTTDVIRVYAYPVQRIISAIFLIINLIIFVFKIIIITTNIAQNYSTKLQQFLQIQSYLNMFLPLIMLPFIAGSLIIRTKSRQIQHFKHQINKLVTVPIFLSLGILILLIQLFSISISGLLFFISMMILFLQRKLDFGNFTSWLLVIFIKIICLVFICTNFLATTNLISTYQKSAIFQFYGINAINGFLSSSTQRGYIICLIILFIVSCLVQRIFLYNKIWIIANKQLNLGQIKQSHIFMEQGVNIDSTANRITDRPLMVQGVNIDSTANRITDRPLMVQQRQDMDIILDRKNSRLSLQQYQLTSVGKKNKQFSLPRNHTQLIKQGIYQPLMLARKSWQPSNTQQDQQQLKFNKKKKKLIGQIIADSLLIGINNFVDFINSTQFSLRFTQILSIIVIQRYNNIYSFVAVLWLALVASTQRIRLIYFVTMLILLPIQIGNYVIMYIYNAPQSPIQTIQNLQIYGFQIFQAFWLDIIIFNVYIFYMITFLHAAKHNRSQKFQKQSSQIPSSNFFVFILALIYRYCYLLTIIAIFFLGFSKVTLINLVYVVLFLVFFSSGENVLVEIKTRNNKIITSLTTFSRKYWFIIVYYTLICIIIKYVYFLFFPDTLTQQLQPTGINQQYNWSFNFSLSKICLSNTTPLFIIFILSQAQIMIYRSAIYLNYSFSLISQITDIKRQKKNKFRIFLNILTQVLLEFYYQGLYYVAGLIILACSFRWSIIGLCIVIITVLGLMREFNKPILALIVFLDLAFIIVNYLVLFTTYEVSRNFIGQTGVQVIQQISLLLGLSTQSNTNLTGMFALNIVIFYFAVQSYGLKKILQQNRFNEQTLQRQSQYKQDSQNRQQQKQDTISSYQPTILQQQYNDIQFAKNFNKNVIIATKKLYQTILWKKYNWWFKICRFLSIFSTDFITIFMLVCCLIFRLSVSMFYFLLMYMIYYFVLFDKIGQLMEDQQFYQKIQRQFILYKHKQACICQRQPTINMLTGQQSISSLLSFISNTKQKAIKMRFQWRYLLWFYTSIITAICFIITYTAQFIISDFYQNYINSQYTQQIENILFVLGFSVTKQESFFRQAYFYYFMVFIAVVEKLILRFIKQHREDNKIEEPVSLTKKQYKRLQDPQNFIDQSLSFIAQTNIKQQLYTYISYRPINQTIQPIKSQQSLQQQSQLGPQLQPQISKQSNLLIYFDYKGTIIKINYMYGALMFLLRLYLLMMLINLYKKSNIFSFVYLISVLYFWFQKLHFRMVRHINKIAIIILLLQYLLLLLDITPDTSSLPLPYYPYNSNLSVFSLFLPPKWISYLVVDSQTATVNSFLTSFLISSIIIFFTQLYFTMFFWISHTCVSMIKHIYQRYEYIGQSLRRMPDTDTIYLNYKNYKSWSYRAMTLFYQLLINNSYIVVSYLILILLSSIHNYISFGLVCFACIYIYVGIFTGFSQDQKIYSYTVIFFRIVQIILFIILFLISIAQIPVFIQTGSVIKYIQALANLQQIFLLFLIQIWLDLAQSIQFRQATQQYNNCVRNRQNVMIKCLAYQQNQDLIKRMLKRYKQALWFQVNLKNALQIIDQWHKAMYKKKIPQFQNLKKNKSSPHILSLQQQIKKIQQSRPQQDQSISQKFIQFMATKTSVPLRYGYYQIMRFIVLNNHRLINLQNTSLDIWEYVLEDYQKLNYNIKQAQGQLNSLVKSIQQEQLGNRMDRLQQIKNNQFSYNQRNFNQKVMGIIKTPKKIFINIKVQKQTTSQIVLLFIMSNFPYILSFFIWIYYILNPCLLSLPFILYFFAFEIISDRKLTSLMLIYIFSIILLSLWLQIKSIPVDNNWIKYLFFKNDGQNDQQNGGQNYDFDVGYLLFVFILIFVNQEIKKYQGNKFKYQHQAENRLQGAFRILINQDHNSELNLWKLKVQQDQQEQKQSNPMDYFSTKIQENPQKLTDCPMPGFFDSFNQGKTGIDLYPWIASVQIFITIYLIFFYPLMTQSQNSSLQQSLKYFQFSSSMVLSVLIQVFLIVIQRKITLIDPKYKSKSLIKYIFTMMLLVLFLVFIYYIAPTSRQIKGVYSPTSYLIAFSILYFFYFFLSALQIRFGYKKYKSLNSMLTRRRQFNSIMTSIFTAVPFLYQLKLMMDYSFCQTSLKLFDWFKLFSIYLSAFQAKMQYYSSTGVILGQPQPWTMKSLGWLGFIAILLIIFGPMILFSGLNPIAQPNLVIGGALQIGIQIKNGNYFGLYSTSHFSTAPLNYTPQLFYDQNFQQVPALQTLTNSDISQQFQLIQFQPYSDSNWGISYPNLESLTSLMNYTIQQMMSNKTPSNSFNIYVTYELNRRVTQISASDTNFMYPTNGTLNLTQLQDLYTSITQCNRPTYLPGFYISLIRLFTVGNSYKPSPIKYINTNNQSPYLEGVYMTLFCEPNGTTDSNNAFWAVFSTNTSSLNPDQPTDDGLFMNVLCDKYQNLIAGLGFTALYTSVILVVAGFIRGLFEGNLPLIPYTLNPKPDNIIQISQAIGTLRDRKQFRQQYLMYFQLIDIIRSPDLMKYLSGSYPILIEMADQKRKRKQYDKEIQNNRDKIE